MGESLQADVSVRPLTLADMDRFQVWGHHQDIRFSCYDFPDLGARRGGYAFNSILWFMKRNVPGLRWVYAIEDAHGNLSGYFKIVKKRVYHSQAELSMVLDPSATGRGFGTGAFIPLLRICFENLGLGSVWVSVVEFNIPSLRLLEKTGFIKYHADHAPYDDQSNQEELLQSYPQFFFMEAGKLMCRLSYLKLTREAFAQMTQGKG